MCAGRGGVGGLYLLESQGPEVSLGPGALSVGGPVASRPAWQGAHLARTEEPLEVGLHAVHGRRLLHRPVVRRRGLAHVLPGRPVKVTLCVGLAIRTLKVQISGGWGRGIAVLHDRHMIYISHGQKKMVAQGAAQINKALA